MYEYESGFFDYVNVGSLRSASALVPILTELLTITSVLNLGCGQGAWLKVKVAEHLPPESSETLVDNLPEALRVAALDDQAEIPRVEPIAYRLRCELIRRLPQRSVDAMARLNHYAVSKTRGSAPG